MPTSEAAIADLARRQHQCFTRAQANDLGFSPKQIRHRTSRGIWTTVHRDVFAVGGGVPTLHTRAMAATLALPGSAASHATALHLRGDRSLPSSLVHVVRLHGWSHRLDGVRLHQTRRLPSHHTDVIEGIPVTTVARTLFDLAARLDDVRLGRLIDDAIRTGTTTVDAVGAVFTELTAPGRAGSKRMARVLDRRAGSPIPLSQLEHRFQRVCAQRGLPRGTREFRAPWLPASSTSAERVDVAYPAQRVIVELDGRGYHSRLEDFDNDRRRDQAALAHGWVTLRFTWTQVVREPDRVADVLRRTLALERQGAL